MPEERRPELESFHDVIEQIRRGVSTAPTYRIFNLPLDNARTGEELALAGYNFQIIDASDGFANIQIQFNESLATKVPFRRGDQVITPFYRFFIHNTAQPGSFLTVAVSPHFDLWRFIPNPFASAIINNTYSPSFPGIPINDRTSVAAGIMYQRFMGFATGQPGVGNVLVKQVFNPLGSGKTVLVVQITEVGPSPTSAQARYHDTALANLDANFNPNLNINRDGPAAVSQLRWQSIALASVPPAGAAREQWYRLAANQNLMSANSLGAAILKPGKGLIWYASASSAGGDVDHLPVVQVSNLDMVTTLEF